MKKEFKDILKEYLFKHYATHTIAAAKWGITRQYLSKIVNGRAEPTAAILYEMGYEKKTETTYTKVKK